MILINAAKLIIGTPVISARLENPDLKIVAGIIKGQMNKSLLGNATHCPSRHPQAAARAGLKLTGKQVMVPPQPRGCLFASRLKEIGKVKRRLPLMLINGYTGVDHVSASYENAGGTLNRFVEGYGLRQVVSADSVLSTETTSNHAAEIESVLAIESARNTIMREVQDTMLRRSTAIDPRHLRLLANATTYTGEVLEITHFGASKPATGEPLPLDVPEMRAAAGRVANP
ncbi:DNA-directed RNA polymerase III subunit C1 (rpo31) [Blastocladiella emersonii ATCC 22665]|nr:DNA-directed RNA polymerase III subunit C1 (rpo31) [Blastocladiella emersonii ATCC 22665]